MPNKPKFEELRQYFFIDAMPDKYGLEAVDLVHWGAQAHLPLYVLAENWEVDTFIKYEETD